MLNALNYTLRNKKHFLKDHSFISSKKIFPSCNHLDLLGENFFKLFKMKNDLVIIGINIFTK